MKKLYMVYKNVILGKEARIEPFCLIGKPPKKRKEGELKLAIGKSCLIRVHSTIYAGSRIGDNFITGASASVREGNVIGDNVSVGTSTVLEAGNKIGNNVRIHSGCFLEMAEVGDDVFIGPRAVMIDDLHPPCPRFKECVGGARIGKGASIGANSTILPGIKIGAFALVGAGSVVTKNVPAGAVVAGNPARIIKKVEELKCVKGLFKKPYEWRGKSSK